MLSMANFMDPPREIRDIIYFFDLVVPDKVFIPKRFEPILMFRPQGFQKPTVPLLCTSKTIHAEGLPIFYGQNTFQLPASPDYASRTVFGKHAALFRHIIVRFGLYDFSGMSVAGHDHGYYKIFHPTFYPDSPICHLYHGAWSNKQILLLPMTNLRSIYFTVDSFLPLRRWEVRMCKGDLPMLGQYASWLLPILRECFKPLVDGAKGRPGGVWN